MPSLNSLAFTISFSTSIARPWLSISFFRLSASSVSSSGRYRIFLTAPVTYAMASRPFSTFCASSFTIFRSMPEKSWLFSPPATIISSPLFSSRTFWILEARSSFSAPYSRMPAPRIRSRMASFSYPFNVSNKLMPVPPHSC